MRLIDKASAWWITAWRGLRSTIADERLRRYRMWVFQGYVLAVLVVFCILAFFASLSEYFAFDLEVTRELQAETPAWLGWALAGISWFGYAAQSVATVTVTVILLSLLGLRWESVSALFASVCSGGLNYLIKIAIRRPRPSADLVEVISALNSYSFPSGHVMFYITFFGFLLFLAFLLLKNSARRNLLLVLLAIPVFTVGLSRMYLGEHWASDVIGGYLLGSLTLILTIQFYRWGKMRWSRGQALAPPEEDTP
jgi:undecaprenyl-diphosphatase